MRSALLAGALLAFALSFDEIVVTTFTAGSGFETLPLWIFNNMFRPNNLPLVNVVATVVVVLVDRPRVLRAAAQRRRARRERTMIVPRSSARGRATSTRRCRGRPPIARRSRVTTRSRRSVPVHDRRATAASLRAIDAAHGGGFYAVPEAAIARSRRGRGRVRRRRRSGRRRADPSRRPGCAGSVRAPTRSAGFLRMADPERWTGPIDPRAIDGAAWAALVFGASETAVALLTSTPGPADVNVLDERARSRRRATSSTATRGPGACSRTRSCTRTSVRASSTRWPTGERRCGRRGGSATRCGDRRRRRRRPAAGSSTTTRSASRSSNGCARARAARRRDAQGPRRPDPRRVGRGRVAARHRPGRGRVPRHHVRRVPLRLRARPGRRGGSVRSRQPERDTRRRPARAQR